MPTLTINGRTIELGEIDPHMTVLDLLRARGLIGTKEGCAEGECGACAVALLRNHDEDERGGSRYVAINSCLTLAGSVAGAEIISVEGVRPDPTTLHPVQAAMVEQGGSQCGYCTPGFVVSMFAEYYRPDRPAWDPEAIAGNLCRCTGYRPIRDAMRELGRPGPDDRFAARLREPAPQQSSLTQLRRHHAGERRLCRPSSLGEALERLAAEPTAKLVAGGTDVVVEINQRDARWPLLLALEGVAELRTLVLGDDVVEIGAGVSLSDLEHRLGGALPLLDELFPLFSSRLIRNRATLGGNLANASPIGDSPPALLALDAQVELTSLSGARIVPLAEFFVGYRKTVLVPGELLTKVLVPRRRPTHAHFYKVSKRVLDDISTVAAGFAIDLDEHARVTRARLAYGGVAATPIRARAAEDALIGQTWTRESVAAIAPLITNACTPMADHRGSADYRRAMIVRLLEKFWAETQAGRRLGPQPPPVVTQEVQP